MVAASFCIKLSHGFQELKSGLGVEGEGVE